mgnify:CR=1 FL=1
MAEDKIIKGQLTEFLETYYDGSFSLMACDYILSTEMTRQEVKELMEVIRKEKGA